MNRANFALILLLLLGHLAWAQSPCVRVSSPLTGTSESDATCPPDPNAIFNNNAQLTNFAHVSPTSGLIANDSARYKAFWILGDGNFIFHPDRHKAADMATLNQNYIYHKNGSFEARAVMVEKKSNKQPPDKRRRPVNVKITTQQVPGTSFTQQITGNNRAALSTSSDARLGGYATALVVSSKLPSTSNTVAVVLYNSVKAGARNATWTSGNVFPVVEVDKPNYLSPDFPHILGQASNMPTEISTVMANRGYGNFIVQELQDNNDIRPSAFTEFRIFPIFETAKWINQSQPYDSGVPSLQVDGTGETQFLTLILENVNVTGNAGQQPQVIFPASTSVSSSSISPEERGRIVELLTSHAPSLLAQIADQNTLRLTNGMFIRGVAHQTARIVSSIDPTALTVQSICADGNDKYDVKMRMTICNEGSIEEALVVAEISNTAGLQIRDANFDQTGLNNFDFQPSGTPTWKFTYPDLPAAYDNTGKFKEDNSNCISRDFSFKTDWAGAQQLANEGALKANITFTTAFIKPTQIFPSTMMDAAQLSKEKGYQCQPGGNKPDSGNYWWLYVVLFALGLVAWWWWRMKQEEEGN